MQKLIDYEKSMKMLQDQNHQLIENQYKNGRGFQMMNESDPITNVFGPSNKSV